jgi:integrase
LLKGVDRNACWQTLLPLAVSFGLRISEVVGLKWKDVDWLGKTIQLERGVVKQIVDDVKSPYSAGTMVCADELLEMLKQWKQITQFSAPEDWVFASPFKLGSQPLCYTYIWETLTDAAEQAGMGHLSSHVSGFCRYSCGRTAEANASR